MQWVFQFSNWSFWYFSCSFHIVFSHKTFYKLIYLCYKVNRQFKLPFYFFSHLTFLLWKKSFLESFICFIEYCSVKDLMKTLDQALQSFACLHIFRPLLLKFFTVKFRIIWFRLQFSWKTQFHHFFLILAPMTKWIEFFC